MRTDEYGFGAAMRSALVLFDGALRGTGRTTRLIERARTGDRIICPTPQIARFIHQLAHQASKKIDAQVWEEKHSLAACAGTTYFEHTFLHRFYLNGITAMESDLFHMQEALSRTQPPEGMTAEQRRAIHLPGALG